MSDGDAKRVVELERDRGGLPLEKQVINVLRGTGDSMQRVQLLTRLMPRPTPAALDAMLGRMKASGEIVDASPPGWEVLSFIALPGWRLRVAPFHVQQPAPVQPAPVAPPTEPPQVRPFNPVATPRPSQQSQEPTTVPKKQRAARGEVTTALRTYLQGLNGQTKNVSAIAAELKMPKGTIAKCLVKLEEAGEASRSGSGPSTRWGVGGGAAPSAAQSPVPRKAKKLLVPADDSEFAYFGLNGSLLIDCETCKGKLTSSQVGRIVELASRYQRGAK